MVRIMNNNTLMVSFSGGRTSGYMARWLQLNKADEYNLVFVFMNTGQEHEETLKFIDRCDKEWGLNLVWLESVFDSKKGVGTTYKVVSYETACRDGSLFMGMCRKYGVPNKSYPHCNRELKIQPFEKYRRDNFSDSKRAIGIRIDEIDRMTGADGVVYPLISWSPTTKGQVLRWWDRQSFNLMIPEHYGNCKTCWKKSDRKLFTCYNSNPEWFDVFSEIENDDGVKNANQDNNSGVFFRQNRSVSDVAAEAKRNLVEYNDPYFNHISNKSNGCGESCDLWSDGQLDMIGYDCVIA